MVSGRKFSKPVSGVQSQSVRLVCGRPSTGQSRSPGFKVGQPLSAGVNTFGAAGAISTRCGFLPRQLPPCLFTSIILTRAVPDPPRVKASRTDFLERRAAGVAGVLNPTSNYRSRPLPSRLETIWAQESTATCGHRRPNIFEPTCTVRGNS